MKRLGEIATFFSGGTPLTSKREYFNGNIPFIKSGEIKSERTEQFISELGLKNSSAKMVNEGDILYALYGATSGEVGISKLMGAINQAILCIRSTQNHYFIYSYLSHKKEVIIKNYLQGGQGNLSAEIIKQIRLSIPLTQEQVKIATFIKLIDSKISTQNKIIKELEVFKSISSKKIFTRQIRFKDSKGNNYSDWKEIKLGNIGETYSGLIGKTKEDFGIGQPYIQYKQIFDSSKIDTTKFGLVTVKSNEHQKKVKKGDVFFTVSSETPDEIGMSSVLLEDIEEIYLNSFCFGFRPNLQILNMHFARYLFRSFTFRDKIMKLAQGSTRYNLSKGEVMKLQISLPQFQEQTQIANFLSSIDSKIDIEIELLKKLEEQKKYLLQNLFV